MHIDSLINVFYLVVEPIVILVMAYLSYMAAELIHWSGIIW